MKVKIEKIQQIDTADEENETAGQMYKTKEPLGKRKEKYAL